MRTVTFNIQHGAKGLDAVAEFVDGLVPDIVFLQEVDRGCRRSGGVDQVADLATRLTLEWAFAEAFPFDGGSFGVAILSRSPLANVRSIGLPHPSPRRHDGTGEPRVLLTARLGSLTVATTHLGLSAAERIDQARKIRETLESMGPVILGGDLNEGPNGGVLTRWSGWLADSFRQAGGGEIRTGPPDRPDARIDFILHSAGAPTPNAAIIGPWGASDHRAVIVDFAQAGLAAASGSL